MLAYSLPALALVWYLLLRTGRSFSPFSSPRPRLRDLVTALFTLPALVALGALLSLLGAFLPDPVIAQEIGFPQGPAAILVMILSSLSTGYLEESYFRFYLSRRFAEAGVGRVKAMLISSLLFALCHLYEGPLGALNAFLAGTLLFFIYTRRRSLHGVAWAHGLYNVFVYVMAGITGA
jgi:membrane protease YdiL (CAAX protease family)